MKCSVPICSEHCVVALYYMVELICSSIWEIQFTDFTEVGSCAAEVPTGPPLPPHTGVNIFLYQPLECLEITHSPVLSVLPLPTSPPSSSSPSPVCRDSTEPLPSLSLAGVEAVVASVAAPSPSVGDGGTSSTPRLASTLPLAVCGAPRGGAGCPHLDAAPDGVLPGQPEHEASSKNCSLVLRKLIVALIVGEWNLNQWRQCTNVPLGL